MGSVSSKIMGMLINVSVDDVDEFAVNKAIEFANEKYGDIKRIHTNIEDSNTLRAFAILNIIMELQTIRDEQAGISDRNVKKVDNLIRIIDKLDLSD